MEYDIQGLIPKINQSYLPSVVLGCGAMSQAGKTHNHRKKSEGKGSNEIRRMG